MAAATSDLAVGDEVTLAVSWGNQTRLRCPACQRYMAATAKGTCRCGTVYAPCRESGQFKVVSRG